MLASAEIELSFAAYDQRQRHEVSHAGLVARAARLAPGGNFLHDGRAWRPQPYPGHAVVAMVATDTANRELERRLSLAQSQLADAFAEPDLLYLLPAASFHQTVANTLSDDRYKRHVVDAGIEHEYPGRVGAVLGEISATPTAPPVRMRMIGVSLFGSALGALGVFESSEAFLRVLAFRDAFYGHADIAALGITRTRPFIGHVTLAYLGRTISEQERTRLVESVWRISAGLFHDGPTFSLPWAELRAYDHLAEFKPLPDLPRAGL